MKKAKLVEQLYKFSNDLDDLISDSSLKTVVNDINKIRDEIESLGSELELDTVTIEEE